MTYELLQQYWWFLISLLGGLLVFLLFVQGGNSQLFSIGRSEEERRLLVNSTGRKWEFTFTTLVTFGGAFFASFPLFYSTSFGGAYWLWMLILLSFVLQAVSYEFQNKLGNLLGTRTFQWFLVANGIVGPLLLGGAVATFFNGSNFVVEKDNLVSGASPVISHWANASHGLDALLDPWNLVLAFAVLFLARVLGPLYFINNVADEAIRSRSRRHVAANAVPFLVLFVAVHLIGVAGIAAVQRFGQYMPQGDIQQRTAHHAEARLAEQQGRQAGPLGGFRRQKGHRFVAGGDEHRQQCAGGDYPAGIQVGGHRTETALRHTAQKRAGHKAPASAAGQRRLDAVAVVAFQPFDQQVRQVKKGQHLDTVNPGIQQRIYK